MDNSGLWTNSENPNDFGTRTQRNAPSREPGPTRSELRKPQEDVLLFAPEDDDAGALDEDEEEDDEDEDEESPDEEDEVVAGALDLSAPDFSEPDFSEPDFSEPGFSALTFPERESLR